MEEPVHDDQQDDDREQPGGGLEVEGGDVVGEAFDDADGDEPGDQGEGEGAGGAGGDRPLVGAFGARHVRGDRGEDEDALEPLAEDQDGDIQHARPEVPSGQGVGKAPGPEDLQDQDGGHRGHPQGQRERQDSRLHVIKTRQVCRLTISDRKRRI